MIHELVYTSAKSGLKPGSRGYCTVASSAGMSKPMAEKLESLSGYRHIFPPGTIEADKNPVAYSYVRLQIAGILCHVLSRVADAGLDYSGRSNKLAHHVVLEQQDLVREGPAACLADRRFALRRWTGDARILPPKSVPPLSDSGPTRQHWESASSDPNWCDYLIQNVRQRKPVYVVYPIGTEVLPLIADAQSLLPSDERWHMTFSTYFTRVPPGVECLVRCIPAETKEAKAILGRHDQVRIDLSSHSRAPATSIVSTEDVLSPTEEVDVPYAEVPSRRSQDAGDLKLAPPEIPSVQNVQLRGTSVARRGKQRGRSLLAWMAIGLLIVGGAVSSILWRDSESSLAANQPARQAASDDVDNRPSVDREPEVTPEVTDATEGNVSQAEAPVEAHSAQPAAKNDGNAGAVDDTPTLNFVPTAVSEEPLSPTASESTASPAVSSVKPVHWILNAESHQAISANEISSLQIRPQPHRFVIQEPDAVGGEWTVDGPDEEGFDSTYLTAGVDPVSRRLQVRRGTGGQSVATHTVIVTLDNAQEVFVHPESPVVIDIPEYMYDQPVHFKIADLTLPILSSARAAVKITVDGNAKQDIIPISLEASRWTLWLKVKRDLAILLSIDPDKRAGSLRSYISVGKPPRPKRLSDVLAKGTEIGLLVDAVNDTEYVLKRVEDILQILESPDDEKRLSTRQQQQIRKAAREIADEISLIEPGSRQFRVKQHLTQSVPGKNARGAMLFLAQTSGEFPKVSDKRVRALEQFRAFLTTSAKQWKSDEAYQPEVYETMKSVQQISAIEFDIVFFKSPEIGAKFPFLRIRTTETTK